MKSIGCIFPLALLLYTGNTTAEAAAPNALCERTRGHGLDEIYADLTLLDNSAPQVPPEELSYLRKEYPTAFHTGDALRVGMVVQRPYYPAWQVHISITNARASLDTLKSIPVKPWPKMHIMSASHVESDLADVRDAWTEFGHSRFGESLPLKAISNTSYAAAQITGSMGSYIFCWAELVPDDK
jgi:hypothetical protein